MSDLLNHDELGRALVERRDPNSRIADFEWSVPDDAYLVDPAVWASALPALGHTITLDTIRAEFEVMANDPVGEVPGLAPSDFADDMIAQTLAAEVRTCKAAAEKVYGIAAANGDRVLARHALGAINSAARMEAAL